MTRISSGHNIPCCKEKQSLEIPVQLPNRADKGNQTKQFLSKSLNIIPISNVGLRNQTKSVELFQS